MVYPNKHDLREGTPDMPAVVAAYRKSGLGLRRFAEERKISLGRLHYWVYQKQRDSRPRATTKRSNRDGRPAFEEVKFTAGTWPMDSWAAEVRLPSGVSVRLSSATTPGWIGELMQALQRPC
jgi:hypothetical protein